MHITNKITNSEHVTNNTAKFRDDVAEEVGKAAAVGWAVLVVILAAMAGMGV